MSVKTSQNLFNLFKDMNIVVPVVPVEPTLEIADSLVPKDPSEPKSKSPKKKSETEESKTEESKTEESKTEESKILLCSGFTKDHKACTRKISENCDGFCTQHYKLEHSKSKIDNKVQNLSEL
jgi:hypothetical protein